MSNLTAPIVLIHGLWLSADSWRPWIERYRSAGHVVHAPDWPADTGIGLAEATDHFDAFVRSLPDVPIIIGHSMGGLITQLLLDRGLGRAGVAIAPSKPRGVLRAPLSMWRSAMAVAARPAQPGQSRTDQRGPLSLRFRQYDFARRLRQMAFRIGDTGSRQRRSSTCPPPTSLPKSRAASAVDFANSDRAPLLLVAGDRDHLMPVVGGLRELQSLPAFVGDRRTSRSFDAARTSSRCSTGGKTWPITR